MLICIVCGNTRCKFTSPVSLHCFPKNKILQEAWLRKIGKIGTRLSKQPRICSLHFSEDCFQKPRRSKKTGQIVDASRNVLKRLVPNAFPTLLLTSSSRNDRSKANIIGKDIFTIRREFKLHVAKPDINKDGVIINARTAYNSASTSGINKHSTISQPDVDVIHETSGDVSTDPLNVTASIENIETPKPSRSNPWLDAKYRSCHSPPRETNRLVAERCKSEPRTLGRTQTCRRARSKKKPKIQSRSSLRRERECRSVEPSPVYKRQESFFNENCLRNNQDNSKKDTEKEDLRGQVQLLNELVQHNRSISNFRQTSIEVENNTLKLQLQQANAEIERLRAEKKNLERSLDDLHVAVEQPMDGFSGEMPAIMPDLLKQYFTDGQIKSILEAKYRYFVYN